MVFHPLQPTLAPSPLHASPLHSSGPLHSSSPLHNNPLLLPSFLVSLRPTRTVSDQYKTHQLSDTVSANQEAISKLTQVVAKLVNCHSEDPKSTHNCNFHDASLGIPLGAYNGPMQPVPLPMLLMPMFQMPMTMPMAMQMPQMPQIPYQPMAMGHKGVTYETTTDHGPRNQGSLGPSAYAHVEPSVQYVKGPPQEIVTAPVPAALTHRSAVSGQLPWLISLQVTDFEKVWIHLCGGTLIAPAWVLTAAHCLDSERVDELVVVVGEHDLEADEGTEQKVRVAEFIQHPDYEHSKRPMNNDIALIKLSEAVEMRDGVSVAELPSEFQEITAGMCREGGWGPTMENAAGPRVVKINDIPVWDQQECHQAYNATVGDNALCAGSQGVGACVGDNGGPLICNTTDGEVTAGVMSWREGCALVGKPGVYMDVAKFLPWINEVMRA